LSWSEVAEVFHTSWGRVYRSVEMAVTWGLEHRDLEVTWMAVSDSVGPAPRPTSATRTTSGSGSPSSSTIGRTSGRATWCGYGAPSFHRERPGDPVSVMRERDVDGLPLSVQ